MRLAVDTLQADRNAVDPAQVVFAQVFRRSLIRWAPLMQQHGILRVTQGVTQVVQHNEYAHTPGYGDFCNYFDDINLIANVQVVDGFVQQKYRSFLRKCAGNECFFAVRRR